MSGPERLGVLGGTFDPVHSGHLDVAEAARAALDLSNVLLMPSRVAPHRSVQASASSYHRFAMVALATADRPSLLASDFELQHPGPSYTSVTMDRLASAGYNPRQLYFIAGADAFAEIATWRDYPILLQRCHFVVVTRPGFTVTALRRDLPELAHYMKDVDPRGRATPTDRLELPSIWLVDAKTSAVASTEIRQRVESAVSLVGFTPPLVEAYIGRNRLYEAGDAASELHE